MSDEILVFEVSDASYGKYVMLNSHKAPVVMAFIGAWSEHCFVLDNLFTRLAEEFAGQFVFAKLDIDENPGCRQRYEIADVPTLIVFRDGEIARREEGMVSEDEARAMLKDFGIFRQSDEQRMQARAQHMLGNTPAAVTRLAEAMKADPGNIRIAMDMVQIFIDLGQLDEAGNLFASLPQSNRDSVSGRSLNGQLQTHRLAAGTDGPVKLAQRILDDENDLDARFDMALCQVAENNYHEAMNHLFHILQEQKDYRGGAAREMVIALVDTLAERNPDIARLYRRQLADMLHG